MSRESGQAVAVAAAPGSHRFLYLLAAVAQGAGPLITQPFVQRTLDPEQWGRVSFSISLVSVALIVILVGLPLIITRAYFDGPDGPRKAASLSGFGILQSAGLGVLGVGVAVALATAAGRLADNLSTVIALAVVGLLGGIQMCLSVLRAQHRAMAFVGITIGAQTLGHLAGLAAVLFVSRSAAAYMGAFAVVVALTSAASLVASRPGRPFAFPGLVGSALRTSAPMLPHSVALVLMLQGESFILTALHGPAFYGKYGAMLPMALGPLAVIMALANVWETAILAHRGDDAKGAVRRIMVEGVAVGVALAVAASASAVLAANILAHDPTVEQLQLARIMPAMAMGYIVFLLGTTQLVAIGRTRLMALITPVVTVLDLGVMLIPASAGSLFWVGATKVAAFVLLGVAYMAAARRHGRHLMDARIMVLGLVVSVAVCALMLLLPTDFWFGVGTFSAALVAFAAAALWLWRSGRLKAVIG